MKSMPFLITAAALSARTAALQSPFRIRTPQHHDVSNIIPLIHSSTVKEKPQSTLNGNNLSPFLQEMVDEQREFQMNVGKAIDVLKVDYPYFLKRTPDYSIYSKSITLTSTSTPITSTLSSYQKAISITRSMLNLLYDSEKTIIQNRIFYDSTRCQIRVSFNAQLIPRNVLARRVYIDGISVYSFDLSPVYSQEGERREESGKIVEHRIEKMLVNGVGIKPPYWNVFGLEGVQNGALAGVGAWS